MRVRAGCGLLLLAVTAVVGCYAPTAPSASFVCGEGRDNACPANLACHCGMCVVDADAAACSFEIKLSPGFAAQHPCSDGAATVCVGEGDEVEIDLAAFTADGRPSRYAGPAQIGSSWGHARSDAFSFSGGTVAGLKVRLDRATPPNGSAILSARAGSGVGVALDSIAVDPPAFILDARDANAPALVLAPSDAVWANVFLGFPALDRAPDGRLTLYFAGLRTSGLLQVEQRSHIGIATLGPGNQWAVAPQPLFSPPGNEQYYLSPTVIRSQGEVHVFYSAYGSAVDLTPDLLVSSSRDGGQSFAAPRTALSEANCRFCTGSGILYSWVLQHPTIANEWLLYFNGFPIGLTGSQSGLGLARTRDRGGSWVVSPIPTPSSGQIGASGALAPRVLYDAATETFRMWYAAPVLEGRGACVLGGCLGGLRCGANNQCYDPCQFAIRYATSEDGRVFVGSREGASIQLSQLPAWAQAKNRFGFTPVGIVPGAVEALEAKPGAPHYALYFSAVVNAMSAVCLPIGVGVAYRR